MTDPLSLLEFVTMLEQRHDVQADFAADPGGVLSAFGLGDLHPTDVADAAAFVADNRTIEWSRAAYDPDFGSGDGGDDVPADMFDRDHDVAAHDFGHDDFGHDDFGYGGPPEVHGG